jgi:hypothetical protein
MMPWWVRHYDDVWGGVNYGIFLHFYLKGVASRMKKPFLLITLPYFSWVRDGVGFR